MFKNIDTYKITAGSVNIGGGSPVSIQTMWEKPLTDIAAAADEIDRYSKAGCDLIRFAVPDMKAADLLGELAEKVSMPIVADIHFDYRIALRCMDYNISKIRINPGNIGSEWKVRDLLLKAIDKNIPLRVGVNAGSLPAGLRSLKDKAEAMLLAAEQEINIFEKYNFKNSVFSLKSSDTVTTVRANKLFSEKYCYPLHIGVTEAGPLVEGIVKSTAAILELLKYGIGDTVRVSLSALPIVEINAAKAILFAAGKRFSHVNIISCPKCGRSTFDVYKFLESSYDKLQQINKPLTVAVMGCSVNGPEEAKDADIGITGTGNSIVIFKKGEIIKKTTIKNAETDFWKEIEAFEL